MKHLLQIYYYSFFYEVSMQLLYNDHLGSICFGKFLKGLRLTILAQQGRLSILKFDYFLLYSLVYC